MSNIKNNLILFFLAALLLVSISFIKVNAAIVFSNDVYFQTDQNVSDNDLNNTELNENLDTNVLENFKLRKQECSVYVANPQKYFGCLER